MDSYFDRDETPTYSPRYHEAVEDEEEEEDDINYFQAPVSGFGESDGIEEGSVEPEDSKTDDALKENTAIQVYQDMHPSREQIALGGREIGEYEAIWSVSSFRPDWGPEKLRDNNALTYWQSDCPNPSKNHTIDLIFHQATFISQVSMFIDYFQDESYTPKTIAIRGGTTMRDLYEIMVIECEQEFVGWLNADITSRNDGDPFRVFRLQVAILNTHSNGRDTHIRQLKVYSLLPSYLPQGEKEKEQVKTVKKPIKYKGVR